MLNDETKVPLATVKYQSGKKKHLERDATENQRPTQSCIPADYCTNEMKSKYHGIQTFLSQNQSKLYKLDFKQVTNIIYILSIYIFYMV